MKILSFLAVLSCPFLVFSEVKSIYLRADQESGAGFYLWVGGNITAGKTTLAHDLIYYPQANGLETEIGPYLSYANGAFDLCPMLGFYTALGNGGIDYVMPQLYLYSTTSRVYLEAWNLFYAGIRASTKDAPYFYGRYFALFSAADGLGIGPHLECTVNLPDYSSTALASLQYGGAVKFAYGKQNSLLVFLGADWKAENKFVSRFTFIHTFPG